MAACLTGFSAAWAGDWSSGDVGLATIGKASGSTSILSFRAWVSLESCRRSESVSVTHERDLELESEFALLYIWTKNGNDENRDKILQK
jgi:hypothetical protein